MQVLFWTFLHHSGHLKLVLCAFVGDLASQFENGSLEYYINCDEAHCFSGCIYALSEQESIDSTRLSDVTLVHPEITLRILVKQSHLATTD